MEFLAVNRRRPSRETPIGPGAKKDGCFRRLGNRSFRYLQGPLIKIFRIDALMAKSVYLLSTTEKNTS